MDFERNTFLEHEEGLVAPVLNRVSIHVGTRIQTLDNGDLILLSSGPAMGGWK
jgi:hypothetical protein